MGGCSLGLGWRLLTSLLRSPSLPEPSLRLGTKAQNHLLHIFVPASWGRCHLSHTTSVTAVQASQPMSMLTPGASVLTQPLALCPAHTSCQWLLLTESCLLSSHPLLLRAALDRNHGGQIGTEVPPPLSCGYELSVHTASPPPQPYP